MTISPDQQVLDFELSEQQTSAIPTEERGLDRDAVRLMVSQRSTDRLFDTTFTQVDRFLRPGDVLVINTSATLPAALDTILPDGRAGRIHLSNQLAEFRWRAELRVMENGFPRRYFAAQPGDVLPLPGGGQATLEALFYRSANSPDHLQLWEMQLDIPETTHRYLAHFGRPIRYDDRHYPLEYYQTVFAQEAGSVEMPSAGRAFTHALITRLLIKGIQFAPITLHTGVSSLETHELPYPEYFHLPATTATQLNDARRRGRRIIAVGTTAVRAVESAVDERGTVVQRSGWTDHYISPDTGLRVINGLLTGFHEPRASHLQLLAALAGQHHLELAYRAAVEEAYQWHEFGDLHLIV